MSRRVWKTVRLEAQEFSTGGKGLSRRKKRMHLETKDCLRKGVWILGSCRDNREVGLTHCKENIYYLAVTIGNAALWRRGLVIPESGIKRSGSQICVCVKLPRELEKIQMLWSHLQGSWFSRRGVEPMIFVSNNCPGGALDDAHQSPLFEGHYSNPSWKNPSATV